MKKLLLILFLLPLTTFSQEKETLSGQVMITCDLRTDLMENGGFKLIKETEENGYKVSYYGANKAKIIVKNSEDKIIGIGKASEDGMFNVSVKPDSFYTFQISFLSLEIEETLSSDDAKSFSGLLGKASSDDMVELLGL